MDDYISKPIQVKELQEALERQAAGSPAPGAPEGPPVPAGLDQKVLDDLRQLEADGAPDLIADLIGLFRTETPPLITAIRDAVAEGNPDKLRAAAHTLKGSSSTLGARGLAELSGDLERRARGGAVTGAGTLLESLSTEYARVCQALEGLQKAAARNTRV
jgi:HPt (histidine-containing phosphotransfer) domain-containing protein